MPTPSNTEAACEGLLAALHVDLAGLERRVVNTRALIKALAAYAGMAGEPAAAPGEAAVPSSAPKSGMSQRAAAVAGKGKGKGSAGGAKSEPPDKDAPTLAEFGVGKVKAEVSGGTKSEPPAEKAKPSLAVARSDRQRSKADDEASAAELSKVVGIIAKASAQAQRAKRDGAFEELKAAIELEKRSARRAGALLVAMNGRVKRLAGGKSARRCWRHAALLDAAVFEEKLKASQHLALRLIGAPYAMLADAIGAAPAKPQPVASAPKDRPTHAAPPKPAMKLSAWRQEADGSLSRTLTGVDAEGADAP